MPTVFLPGSDPSARPPTGSLLPITSLRRDGGTQPRTTLNLHWVEEYAQDMLAGAAFPPVVVFYDGTDHWLADGFHRTEAALATGADTIAADVRQGTRRDAVLFSVSANGTHGQRRTNEDKRRAVLTLLDDPEWAAWSDREIARQCRVTHPFVKGLRPADTGNVSSMPAERTFVHPRTGQPTTMNTGNIGRRAAEPEPVPPPVTAEKMMAIMSPAYAAECVALSQAGAETIAGIVRKAEAEGREISRDEVLTEIGFTPSAAPPPEPRFDREAADLHRDAMAAISHLATAPGPRTVMDASNKNRGRGVPPADVQRAADWLAEFAALYAVEEPLRAQQVQAWVASIGGSNVAA